MKAEAEKLFYQAAIKFEQSEIASAFDLFSELIAQHPEFGKAYNYLGVIYFNFFKDAAVAESQFKKAISLSPEFAESYINYAALLLSHERFAELNAHLNKVSEIPGVKKDKAFELFGFMNEAQGFFDNAAGFYKKAIAVTFSDNDIERYQKSVLRCESKKKLF